MSRGVASPPEVFFEVALEKLEPSTILGFDLFLECDDGRPVLYRTKGQEFTPEVRARLLHLGGARLVAPVEQAAAYQAHLARDAAVGGTAASTIDSEGACGALAGEGRRLATPGDAADLGVPHGIVRLALSDLNTPGLSRRVQRVAEATARFLLAAPGAYPTLETLLELDLNTYDHSTHTALYAIELARAMGTAEPEALTAIGRAALLHDIGKARLPAELLRRVGRRTSGEQAEFRSHTERGVLLLREAGCDDQVCFDVCTHHHERCDGAGYPQGLLRDQIPLPARIVAVADIFDGLTASTRGRAALSGFQALWRMKSHMKQRFDPDLLDTFVAAMVDPAGRN